MTLTIDYCGNGSYGVFEAFDYANPLSTHPTASDAWQAAKRASNGHPVLVPPTVKIILRLEGVESTCRQG